MTVTINSTNPTDVDFLDVVCAFSNVVNTLKVKGVSPNMIKLIGIIISGEMIKISSGESLLTLIMYTKEFHKETHYRPHCLTW
jgi:hypothetical protein